MRRRPVLVAVLASVLLGCSDDPDSEDVAGTTTTTTTEPTATVESFTGDPDSAFCDLVATAADRPVLDPFEAALEPREVELRFRALQLRFVEFAEAAPPELEHDLDALVVSLADLEEVLAAADYDFTALAESGADVSPFDDPAFGTAATRIDAYRTQVCEQP